MVLIQALVLTFVLKDAHALIFTTAAKMKFEQMCMDLVAEPCFEDGMVLGVVWTVYYSWNEDLDNACLTITFEKATDAVKRRFRNSMKRFLNTEVKWSKATLYINVNWTNDMQQESLQMLLLPVMAKKDSNLGLFQSIPKLAEKDRLVKHAELLPRIGVALKLINSGRFLIMEDCFSGVISLLVRKDQKHTWKEIDDIVDSFKFDAVGHRACKYNLRKQDRL